MYYLKHAVTALLFLSFWNVALSQDFAKNFKMLQDKEDTTAQKKLLQKWESSSPKDPEMFIAWFNYYAQQSIQNNIQFDSESAGKNSIELTDTASGKHVSFMNFSSHYDSETLQKGFDYIERGLVLYPSRLDMRFGKIYMLGEAENFPLFTSTLTETIDYSNKIDNKWLWKDGKPVEDGKKFFLGSIQDYVMTIYNTENDDLLPLMRKISETMLKYYPQHVESLSNVAITYMVAKDYDKGLQYLLPAEKIAPNDVIVLNNIAVAYRNKKENAKAKEYYEKIKKTGTADDIRDANEQIKKLSN